MTYFARTMTDAEKVVMLESLLALVLEQTGPISLTQLDLVKAFQERRTYKTQEMNGFYWIKSDRPVAPITAGGVDLSYGRPGWVATPDPRVREEHRNPWGSYNENVPAPDGFDPTNPDDSRYRK